jgi:D-beta-D-heptose 7-phosphate kinase / D-beta-D-heptose 1-phosphate adenosyltransferase
VSPGHLVVVGDALLDRDLDGVVERLAPDAPVPVVADPVGRSRPGGAALAAALLAADGRTVVLVTGLGDDAAGRELAGLLDRAGVEVVDLGLAGATPEKVRIRAAGRPLLRLDHGGPPLAVGTPGAGALRALDGAAAVLVADYGRGVAEDPAIRGALLAVAPRRPIVWDPHPRGRPPTSGLRLVTPNAAEATLLAGSGGSPGDGIGAIAARGTELLRRWGAAAVCVTLGARGALLLTPGAAPLALPAPRVTAGDPCGAGDRFATAAAGLLADGAATDEAVAGAVLAASAFVAEGGAGGARLDGPTAATTAPEGRRGAAAAQRLVARVRAAGGTVVATGGCFDILHHGHVSVLEGARALGDCLVVCLNSDASVRRLKGPGRPLVGEEDRAAVLEALRAVDAVVIFDEDRPDAVLSRLRPDIWAKGGDYTLAGLPEAALMARWGGQAVVLPHLAGRSTTRLVCAARAGRAAGDGARPLARQADGAGEARALGEGVAAPPAGSPGDDGGGPAA